MVRADDVLELLLPGADARALRRAREVTQFLRLLCDDARRSGAPSVGLDLERARGVLDDHGRDALERALSDLLRHHLAAVRCVDAFVWAGEPEIDAAQAWRDVEIARGDFAGLPELPAPGESASVVGERILAALEARTSEPQARLWRARWTHATQGSRAAEAMHRELLATARRPRPGVLVQRAAIAGVAECLLERGAVREARAWLGEHALQLSVDPRLRRLFAWTRLALEDIAGARAALHGLRPWSGPIPEMLQDLREAQPEWLPCLAGRADVGTHVLPVAAHAEVAHAPRDAAAASRADCGASVFCVLVFHSGVGAEPLAIDVAPALGARRDDWLAEHQGAHAVAGEREQRLVARAIPIVEHAASGRALAGALGGTSTRALAVAPILDDEGDAVGWVHAEFEHHLVPARRRLAAWAADWRRLAIEARSRGGNVRAQLGDEVPRPRLLPGALTTVFQGLVDELGLKTILRRWSGYSVDPNEPVLAAQGGDGQGFGDFALARGRGLARALATGGRIEFDEPDERLAVHVRAASGVVLPLRFDGRICGLLAVESSRRRDFAGVDLDAWSARADHAALALRTAQFRAWHRERFGFEPWYEPARDDFRAFARRVVRAANLRGAVTIAGAAGVGKMVVARWVHFESNRRAGPFVVQRAADAIDAADWSRLLARAEGGTLVLDDVDALDGASQGRLARELEVSDESAHTLRIVAIQADSSAEVRPSGGTATSGLRADLALRLRRLVLCVPCLADRREEIPGLATALLQRFAADEEVRCPQLADDAHALLWRQPWASNVRELENLAYQIVAACPGQTVTADDVLRVAGESGLELLRRIPTRRPRREDLGMALRTTCTAGSRSNKTRAALYLGWDPDTLVARLQDAGLSDQVVDRAPWSERVDAEPVAAETDLGAAPDAADTGCDRPAGGAEPTGDARG